MYVIVEDVGMDFIDELLRLLSGHEDVPPTHATSLYDLMVP
jgi:hypothetical protein